MAKHSKSNRLKIIIQEIKNGKWKYKFRRSGRNLCWSQGYPDKKDAFTRVSAFLKGVQEMNVEGMPNPMQIEFRQEDRQDDKIQWYYVFVRSGEDLCWSEGYSSKSKAVSLCDSLVSAIRKIDRVNVPLRDMVEYVPYQIAM